MPNVIRVIRVSRVTWVKLFRTLTVLLEDALSFAQFAFRVIQFVLRLHSFALRVIQVALRLHIPRYAYIRTAGISFFGCPGAYITTILETAL